MPRRFTVSELAACGALTTTELEPIVRGAIRLRCLHHVWRPSALVATQVPPDFMVPIMSIAANDGERRFRHAVEEIEDHIVLSFGAGIALLDHLRGFTHEQRVKYRALYHVYLYVQQMQAHLDCNFRSRPSLVIKRGSSNDGREHDLLPPDLGIDASGRGRRWTIDRLLDEGTAAAQADGVTRPSIEEKIAYGLFAAARRNPLRRTAAQLRGDMRRALFDADAIVASPGRRMTAIVKDRLYRLMDAHLDEPVETFNRWFFPAGGRNLPRAIARQPNRPGGVLSGEEVTGVLLHLAWEMYRLMSECIGAFGQAFLAALPEPLSRRERELFDLSMMPHRYFGGMPRWLLMERIDFIRPVLAAILTRPRDRELVGALHRLLVWYPEMVRKRREADRLKHQRRRRGRAGDQERLERDLDADGRLSPTDRRRRGPQRRRTGDD